MRPIRNILVPTDFSECSRAAVLQAAWVADRSNATLELLHVWQAPALASLDVAVAGAPPAALSFAELLEKDARRGLDEFVAELAARNISIARASLEVGEPARTIVEVARQSGHDWIVLGTHGRTGLDHALMGSVAEKVLRRAPCPVLSVRSPGGEARVRRFERLLVATDYSEPSRGMVRDASELAESFGASLELVHVWDRPAWVADNLTVRTDGQERTLGELIHENAEVEMERFARELALPAERPFEFRLLSGEPAKALLAEVEQRRIDLLVSGTHGRTGLRHLLLGSVAEKLLRYCPVPVLTVPPAT